jgi:hypothetical protein
MTSIPSSIAAETALLKQNVTLSVVKQSAEQGQAIADLVEESAQSAPINETRGTNVDFFA